MQEIHTLMLPCSQPFSPPAHRRRDSSDELDVFEAARYYSGLADAGSFRSGVVAMKEERRALGGGGGGAAGERRSIDVPVLLSKPSHKGGEKAAEKKSKSKSKQPISPGGRLASFLNSFFHQGSSKKKSKSISTTPSCKDEDGESPAGRRKRRSSISHCRSTRSSESSSSFIYSSSTSASRTVPSLAGKVMKKEDLHDQGRRPSYGELPREKSRRASINGMFDKGGCRFYAKSVMESDAAEKRWVLRAEELPETERRREEEEDGGESDSSSDLFELPNCRLPVHLAGGLPVYESTRMESIKIKRGSSSSSVASVTLL